MSSYGCWLVVTTTDEYVVVLYKTQTQTTSTTSQRRAEVQVQVMLSRSLYRLPAGMPCHLIGETGLIRLSNIPKPTPRTSVKMLFVFAKCLFFSSHYFKLLWSQKPANIACPKHEQESRFSRKKISVLIVAAVSHCWRVGRDTRSPSFSTPSPLLTALFFRVQLQRSSVSCRSLWGESATKPAAAFVISCAVVYICVYILVLS